MGVLKKNEKRHKGRRHAVSTLLKLLFLCSILLAVSNNKATIMGEGFFIIDEVNSISINEGEPGTVLCIQDDLLYVSLINYTEGEGYSNIIQIIDVHQPENPVVVERYEVEGALLAFKISGNIAYMLLASGLLSEVKFFVATLNITDPTNPVLLGSSALVSLFPFRFESSDQISIYKNYTYASSGDLVIFDCSNLSLPVKVAKYNWTAGEMYIKNDLLYMVWNGVKIYSLADPVNPVLLGEINSAKHPTTGSGVYGNYVINAFQDSGIQVYDCTDPTQPTICKDYDFPNWRLFIEGNIQGMAIVGARVFTGGSELYVFDISKPQKLKRTARLTIGDQNLSQITVANNYIYLNIDDDIIIYSYIENSLGRNIGIGIGVGLPVVVGASLFIRWKKKRG